MGSTKELNIIKGEDLTPTLFLTKKSNGRPFDLTGATEIEVRIPKESGVLIKKMTSASPDTVSIVDNAKLGTISFQITDANSNEFKVSEDQNIHIIIDFGTTRRKVNFLKKFNVYEESVPSA